MKHVDRFDIDGIRFAALTYRSYRRIRKLIHEIFIDAFICSRRVVCDDISEIPKNHVIFYLRSDHKDLPYFINKDTKLCKELKDIDGPPDPTQLDVCFIAFDKVKEVNEYANYKLRNL